MEKAVRPVLEHLEQRTYLSLTAIPSTSQIQAIQFQTFDGGVITDSTKGGSVYIPAGANVSIAGIQEASLTVAGKIIFTSAASQVNSLSIPTGGILDLTNDTLTINYGTGTDPIATIKSYLAGGYNGGSWNGAGIDSSTANANSTSYSLGYADSADSGNPAGLASGTIEVKYTLQGDTDLNNIVNGVDFGIVAANFNHGVSRWDQGDFDYNDIVNGIDFGDVAANFNKGATGQSGFNYTSPEQYVASFTDTAGLTLSGITATVNWGDGSAASTGAVVADSGSSSGTYHILATHDFLEAGTYQTTTTISDGTNQIIVPGTIVVSPATFTSSFKPVGLTATSLDSSQIELTWGDVPMLNAVGNSGIALDISTDPNFLSGVTTQTLSSHVTAFVASSLTASTAYYFRIRSNTTPVPNSETATATTKTSGSPAAPTISVAASKSLNSNQTTATLSMTATAPGSDSLSYSWQTISTPLGVTAPTFSYTGSEQTSFASLIGVGTYVFRGVATDVNDSLSVTSDVVVTANQIPTSVGITPGIAGVAEAHTRLFTAVENDQFGSPMTTQPTFSWSQSGTGSITLTGATATYTAPSTMETATITASAAVTGSAIVSVTPATSGGPTVSIQGVPGTITQTSTVSIVVDSPNDTLSSYTLSLTPISVSGSAIILATGTSEVGAGSSAVPIATINPDLIQQGTYTLTLSGTDAAATHSTTQTIQIGSQLKLGNFNLPATDLTINTPSIPLTISRVYDSTAANENRGDFGPGWRLELPDMNVTTGVYAGRGNYNFEGHAPYFAGDAFYITLPGGKEDTFTFQPTDTGTQSDFQEIYRPAFQAAAGTFDHLTVAQSYDNGFVDGFSLDNGPEINLVRNGNEFYTDGSPGGFGFIDYNPAIEHYSDSSRPSFGGFQGPGSGGSQFDGNLYLTTQQGITYTIDATTLRVIYEKDRNGNSITYSSNSITYTPNISGAASTTINITRSGDHITDISDPNGGDIHYTYSNSTGDLISVTQRDNESNGTRDVTSYTYSGSTHLMTQVTDARGANLFTATYGVNGGLVSLADIYGNPVPIQVAPSGSSNSIETTTDLLGNPLTEVYNNNGQLLRKITEVADGLNPAVLRDSVVTYQYNDSFSNNITLQSNPFYSDAANALTASAPSSAGNQIDRTYDGNGNVSTDTSTDSVTNTVTYGGYISYSDPNGNAVELLGKPGTITDPSGAATTNTYDGNGNLSTSTDGTGQEIEYDHNSTGEVTNTNRDFSGTLQLLSTNAYNSTGQLTSTTDFNWLPNGTQSGNVVHDYVYDTNWNQVLSYYYNSTNNQTVVDRTDYDGDDRVIETRHYVLTGNQSFTAASQLNTDTPLITTSTTYNADGKIATTVDEYGGTTFYDYDVKGNLIRTLYPDGTEVRSAYDVLGRLLLQTDRYYTGATSLASPNNSTATRSTLYIYDQTGRAIETDRIDSAIATITQDPGAPTGVNTASWNGQGSLISHDQTIFNSAGQVGAEVGTDGQTTKYTYFTDGKVATQTDALGDVTTYTYSVDSTNHNTSTAVTDANSHTTTTTYDADGRVIKVLYPDSSFTATSHTLTATGETVSEARQQMTGSTPILTNSFYDIDGRLVEVDEPNPTTPTSSSGKLVTTYGYDVYGDETSQTDANSHTTTFTFDSEGRQTSETLPGGTLTEGETYDGFGRENQSTDFDGNITVYDYFGSGVSAGQLEDKKFFTPGQSLGSTPNEETDYSYNNLQQLSQVTQKAAGSTVRTTAYGYDLDGNEISEIVTIAGSNSAQDLYHVYDQATDRLIETYTGNSSPTSATTDIHYGYDALGRLASVTTYRINGSATATDTLGSHNMYSANGSITTTNLPNTVYTYDATGNLHTETLPDGIVQTYGYDALNRLTSETVTEGANNIASFTYSLSTDGQRTQETDNQYNTSGTLLYTNTFNWGYDGDNRLKTETLTAGTGSPDASFTDAYTYDSVGNRLTKTHVVGTNTLSITDTYDSNGDDRLMTETATGTGAYGTTYSYDNNGSLILETRTGTGATTNNYTYDVQNHLVTAVIGNTTTNYAYDADGNRVSSSQGGTTTYYLIDGNNPTGYSQILEQATSFGGTPTITYVAGNAVLGQANSSGILSYLVSDGHGSTRVLADAGGGITSHYDYDAFGNALTSISGTPILYAGQFFDATIQLYYLRARDYDPATGRFTTFDSLPGNSNDPATLHRYLYVADDPTKLVDFSGDQFFDFAISIGLRAIGFGIIGAALGAGVGGAINGGLYLLQNQGNSSFQQFVDAVLAGATSGAKWGAFIGVSAVNPYTLLTALTINFGVNVKGSLDLFTDPAIKPEVKLAVAGLLCIQAAGIGGFLGRPTIRISPSEQLINPSGLAQTAKLSTSEIRAIISGPNRAPLGQLFGQGPEGGASNLLALKLGRPLPPGVTRASVLAYRELMLRQIGQSVAAGRQPPPVQVTRVLICEEALKRLP